jgi:putative spermidine/putrescine transport system permease protein
MQNKFSLNSLFIFFMSVFILFFLCLPILIVIPISFSASLYLEFPPSGFSFQWYDRFFSSYKWTTGLFNSIQIAACVTILATIIGVLASFSFVRWKSRFKDFLFPIVIFPMVTPLIIYAVAYYLFMSQLNLIGQKIIIILAHTVLAIPFVVINVSSSLKGFNINYERAAMSLGANRIKTFSFVTFPIIKGGVIGGAFFAFITSFDEIIVAMFIAGTTMTLPKIMFEGIRTEINPTIAAVSSLQIFFVVIVLLLTKVKIRKNIKGL